VWDSSSDRSCRHRRDSNINPYSSRGVWDSNSIVEADFKTVKSWKNKSLYDKSCRQKREGEYIELSTFIRRRKSF
jgi:hypothetical protein